MITDSLIDRETIAAVCRQFGVVRLRVFGSATSDRFDPKLSDVDFLVDFGPAAPKGVRPYFGLKAALERITGREVDLVVASAVKNPYFAGRAFNEAMEVYAA